ncbi:hypothetical protein GCM10027217_46680 [Pseudomaricurvus hydrocarbonicus]
MAGPARTAAAAIGVNARDAMINRYLHETLASFRVDAMGFVTVFDEGDLGHEIASLFWFLVMVMSGFNSRG